MGRHFPVLGEQFPGLGVFLGRHLPVLDDQFPVLSDQFPGLGVFLGCYFPVLDDQFPGIGISLGHHFPGMGVFLGQRFLSLCHLAQPVVYAGYQADDGYQDSARGGEKGGEQRGFYGHVHLARIGAIRIEGPLVLA